MDKGTDNARLEHVLKMDEIKEAMKCWSKGSPIYQRLENEYSLMAKQLELYDLEMEY